MKAKLLLAIVWLIVAAPTAWAQRGIEVTPFIGGQINGGLDLSTPLYNRIEVQNGLNFGVSAGYLIGNYGSVEFKWNHNKADTVAQSVGGGADRKVQPAYLSNRGSGQGVLHHERIPIGTS